jgi:hypothetical protein
MFLRGLLVCLLLTNMWGNNSENAERKQCDQIVSYIVYKYNDRPYLYNIDYKIAQKFFLLENVGTFRIIFLPKTDKLKHYFNSFVENNSLKPLYGELDGSYFFASEDKIKVDQILKRKIVFDDYNIAGICIPWKYVKYSGLNEYNDEYIFDIDLMHNEYIYTFASNKQWIFADIIYNMFNPETYPASQYQAELNARSIGERYKRYFESAKALNGSDNASGLITK